ncbi:MAG TPA: MFS transporter [Azospirillaceae bacterium]|nr:MFS transporter [Azospirillaceae bacterium]
MPPAASDAVEEAAVRRTLAALALPLLLASLGTSGANVALPAIARDLAAPFGQVQWIVLAYLLAMTALVVGAGRLGDLWGRRRLLLAGLALFTAASALCGMAPSTGWLVAARAAQGLGAAAMMALSTALVGDALPRERTGRAMGLLGTVSALGTAAGPPLGGVLLEWLDWRALFLAMVPLGAAALVLAWRGLPADRAVGSGGTASPGAWPALLRDPALAAGVAMGIPAAASVMASLVVGPFHLSGGLRLDAASVGAVMAAGPAAAALGGVPAGRAVDRFGAPRVRMAGLALMMAGASLLAWVASRSGVAAYVAALVTLTLGYALFQAANTTAVMTAVAADRRGVASGLLALSRNLGLIAGASLMAALFAAGSGAADPATAGAAAIASGMRASFGAAALVLAATLVLSGLAGRISALRPRAPVR